MKSLKNLLPKRTRLSNKTTGGNVLIIGGEKKFVGAGILSALAATKCGAGYTHLMSEVSTFPIHLCPDFILHPLKISELKNKSEYAIGIGPGLGVNTFTLKVIKYLIKNNFQKVVVDADALTIIAKNNIHPLPESWILTPHEGELGRLLNIKSSLIKDNREKFLKLAVDKFKCTIVLKGSTTLILAIDSKLIKCKKAPSSLSKAGTGDVLLGMITAFRAQNLTSIESTYLAANIHRLSAEFYKTQGNDELSLRPTDLIEYLPRVLNSIR